MEYPSRLKQLQFGLVMLMFGIVSILFVLAPKAIRKQFRDEGAKVFKEIGFKLMMKESKDE